MPHLLKIRLEARRLEAREPGRRGGLGSTFAGDGEGLVEESQRYGKRVCTLRRFRSYQGQIYGSWDGDESRHSSTVSARMFDMLYDRARGLPHGNPGELAVAFGVSGWVQSMITEG